MRALESIADPGRGAQPLDETRMPAHLASDRLVLCAPLSAAESGQFCSSEVDFRATISRCPRLCHRRFATRFAANEVRRDSAIRTSAFAASPSSLREDSAPPDSRGQPCFRVVTCCKLRRALPTRIHNTPDMPALHFSQTWGKSRPVRETSNKRPSCQMPPSCQMLDGNS